MIRAVVDTSVLIRGLISRTDPARTILIAIARRTFEVVVSAESLAELRDVLGREGTAQRRIDAGIAEHMVQTLALQPVARIESVSSPIRVRDAKDEYLIRTAVAGNATHIVSVDNDVLIVSDDLRPHGVEVVTPARFLQILGEG